MRDSIQIRKLKTDKASALQDNKKAADKIKIRFSVITAQIILSVIFIIIVFLIKNLDSNTFDILADLYRDSTYFLIKEEEGIKFIE